MARLSRRRLLGALVATGAVAVDSRISLAQPDAIITRPIPSTDEKLPAVGLGSWITFNVGYDEVARASCAEVMRNFFEAGGRLIDSSPMYGSSQATIGYGAQQARQAARRCSQRTRCGPLRARAGPLKLKPPANSGMCSALISCRCTISLPGRSICRLCSP